MAVIRKDSEYYSFSPVCVCLKESSYVPLLTSQSPAVFYYSHLILFPMRHLISACFMCMLICLILSFLFALSYIILWHASIWASGTWVYSMYLSFLPVI